jgi:hypothetical protein
LRIAPAIYRIALRHRYRRGFPVLSSLSKEFGITEPIMPFIVPVKKLLNLQSNLRKTMYKKLLLLAFVASFGLIGIQSAAFAEDCPDRTQVNEETNAKFLKEGIAVSEEALEHAKQGHGPETKAATKDALKKFGCIVTTTGGAQIQRPRERIKMAGIKAGKGDTAAAIPLLEEGIAMMKKVNLTPKGLGE